MLSFFLSLFRQLFGIFDILFGRELFGRLENEHRFPVESGESIATRLEQLGISRKWHVQVNEHGDVTGYRDRTARDVFPDEFGLSPSSGIEVKRQVDQQSKLNPIEVDQESLPGWLRESAFIARDGVKIVDGLFSHRECGHLIELSERTGYEPAMMRGPKGTQVFTEHRKHCRVIMEAPYLANTILWKRVQPFLPKTLEVAGEKWEIQGLDARLRCLRYQPGEKFLIHQDGRFQKLQLEENRIEKSFFTIMFYLNSVDDAETDSPVCDSSPTKASDVLTNTDYSPTNTDSPSQTQKLEHHSSTTNTGPGGGTVFYRTDAVKKYEKELGCYRDEIDDSRYTELEGKFTCQPRMGRVLIFDHRLLHAGSTLKKGLKYTIRSDVVYEKAFDWQKPFKKKTVRQTQEECSKAGDELGKAGDELVMPRGLRNSRDSEVADSLLKNREINHECYHIPELFGKKRNIAGWEVNSKRAKPV